jgi:hypothetical protein
MGLGGYRDSAFYRDAFNRMRRSLKSFTLNAFSSQFRIPIPRSALSSLAVVTSARAQLGRASVNDSTGPGFLAGAYTSRPSWSLDFPGAIDHHSGAEPFELISPGSR